ncbi:MAG: hypothetical protein IPM49_04340 [Flavobacteriales bacterium]|nr:hypothetical protein [Flavobacteriales bacterium]
MRPAAFVHHLHRLLTGMMAALLLISLLLPSLIVGHFLLERDRIERELCVMRDAAPEQNTCHGNCVLMRQLNTSERKAQAPFENLEVRTQPSLVADVLNWPPVLPMRELASPPLRVVLLDGIHAIVDPVPWG